MKQRYTGIDLIKILAIVFVPVLHFYNNYGFSNQNYNSYLSIIEVAIRWIAFSCIGLFIMSTGYLQYEKKISKKYIFKITNYVILYIIYSFITAIIIHGSANYFRNTLYYLFQFPGYFWYMSFFLGLYLILPYLNIIIIKMNEKEFKMLLLIFIVITAIPEFVNSLPSINKGTKIVYLPNWWGEFFPLTYYFIGSYFRKFKPKINKKVSVLVIILTSLLISIYDYSYFKGEPARFIGGGYGSIITLIISICIFSILYDVNIKNSKISRGLAYVSSLTLGIYLALIVSDKLTYMIIIKNFKELVNNFTYKLFFIEVPINFIISFLIAIAIDLVMQLTKKIYKNIKVII